MSVSDLIFWYTGGIVWAVIAIFFAMILLCSLIAGAYRGYKHASAWACVWYVCKLRNKPISERSIIFKELRESATIWKRQAKKQISAEDFENYLDSIKTFVMTNQKEEESTDGKGV